MDNCTTCKSKNHTTKTVPYLVYEAATARAERTAKRLCLIIVLLICMLVGTNVGWLIYESQFETVETVEEYTIQQDAESGNINSIINGGEIINGETNDNLQENG